MRIIVHIGPEEAATRPLRAALVAQRDLLAKSGILFPRIDETPDHNALFLAISDPNHPTSMHNTANVHSIEQRDIIYQNLVKKLNDEIATHTPKTLILISGALGRNLAQTNELARLKSLLENFSDDIEIVAHIDHQSHAITRHYASQILQGRTRSLDLEQTILSTTTNGNWWNCTLQIPVKTDQFRDIQSPPFWVDYIRLLTHWQSIFGVGAVNFRPLTTNFASQIDLTHTLDTVLNLPTPIDFPVPDIIAPSSAMWLARTRQFNTLLHQYLGHKNQTVSRELRMDFLNSFKVEGAEIPLNSLSLTNDYFAHENATLIASNPTLKNALTATNIPIPKWQESPTGNGFRASQYLLSFDWRLQKSATPIRNRTTPFTPEIAPTLPPVGIDFLGKLRASSFRPHNAVDTPDPEKIGPPYAAMTRTPPPTSTGNIIIACLKNEAPYIVEWIAYHRAIGVDKFLIYTNDCDDPTVEILERLQTMGVVEHRNNNAWKGKSPQQYALDNSRDEPLVKDADWIAHIDIDEFINIRCGNGTLADLFAAIPDGTTNIAMTWRLFGHNGVREFRDDMVIEQFDTCAPKFCPKPHTVWGFKSLFQNINAYEKFGCHRPNALNETMADRVKWVNGSGHDMTREARDKGWRNSKKSIGYGLVQLNHYALRSADSFLIKRQRGRALHVGRSIGFGYWVRMDWSNFRDQTIKRNIPRVRAQMAALMADKALKSHHQDGVDWHLAKAQHLRDLPEFRALYDQVIALHLTEFERVAYVAALKGDA